MSETTEARSDDGGALIEYVGGTDRYFVVLLLDGVEIARRGWPTWPGIRPRRGWRD